MEIKKLTRTELAICLGKNPRTITRYRKSGMSVNPDNRTYNLPKCISWLISQAKAAASTPAPDDIDGRKYLSQFRRERALIVSLERRKLEGTLLSRRKIENALFTASRIMRDHILNIPTRVAALVAGETDEAACAKILGHELKEALSELQTLLKAGIK